MIEIKHNYAFYLFSQRTTTIKHIIGWEVNVEDIYTPSLGNYEQLLVVLVDGIRVEYVERTSQHYQVNKNIPKHWLCRILSA